MNLKKISLIALLSASLATSAFSPAVANVTFESQFCDINLNATYEADLTGAVQAFVPDSALTCPFDANVGQISSVWFRTSDGSGNLNLGNKSVTRFNPQTNTVEQSTKLELLGTATSKPFTQVAPGGYSEGSFYLTDPATSKHYRLRLAHPVSLVIKSKTASSCTISLKKNYGYIWNGPTYFVIPDSAVQCQGFTFSSTLYNLSISLDGSAPNQGFIYTAFYKRYNPKSGTIEFGNELRLSTYIPNNLGIREAISGSYTAYLGKLTQNKAESLVTKNSNGEGTFNDIHQISLKAPVTVKRATDVKVKVKRLSPGILQLKISADRNAWFQNGLLPTHTRQTVIPSSRQDRVIIKRGKSVIARVKLSKYGKATIDISDIAGKNSYSLTMVETELNVKGSTTFKR